VNSRSGRSGVSERRRNTPRYTGAGKHLTRYAPDQERPASTSQLTRFTQEHSRESYEDVSADQNAAYLQEVNTAPEPVVTHAAEPVHPAPTQHQALPKTEVVQPEKPQPLRSTQADLYSDAPITISVLKRALPQRFADVEAGKTAGFTGPAKQVVQLGLTHAIRPLKSLFPHDPT